MKIAGCIIQKKNIISYSEHLFEARYKNRYIYIECRKNPQVFSLLDVRHYPWFLIYSITVFGLASPIEQTKYPSDHKVFSFQKYFLNILSYKRHEKTVLSCFSFLTIDVTDSFGG